MGSELSKGLREQGASFNYSPATGIAEDAIQRAETVSGGDTGIDGVPDQFDLYRDSLFYFADANDNLMEGDLGGAFKNLGLGLGNLHKYGGFLVPSHSDNPRADLLDVSTWFSKDAEGNFTPNNIATPLGNFSISFLITIVIILYFIV